MLKVQGRLPDGVYTRFNADTSFVGCFNPHISNREGTGSDRLVLFFMNLDSLRRYLKIVNTANPFLEVEYITLVTCNKSRVNRMSNLERAQPWSKDITPKNIPLPPSS